MSKLTVALTVILFLSMVVFVLCKQPACEIIRRDDFARRRNLWLFVTLAVFLSPSFLMYATIAGLLILFLRTHESNPVALYFFLLFAVPELNVDVPGLGLFNFLFRLSHQRLLALVVLLPAFLVLISRKETLPFGRTMPDKLLAAYIVLSVFLHLRQSSVTDTFREAFYQFIDVFLPYYVASRLLKDLQGFRDALLSFVIVVVVLALIASIAPTDAYPLSIPALSK